MLDSPSVQPPPESGDPYPRWPAWNAGASFAVFIIATMLVVRIAAAAAGTTPAEGSATFALVTTALQDLLFVGTAILFASFTLKPKAWHFGLRRTRFWPAAGWATLGMCVFYLFMGVFAALFQPDLEQDVTERLGAEESRLGLMAAGFMIIVIAPIAEEFFFRGFFYRALRSRFAVPAAATLDGLLFGIIHWDFKSAEGLLLVPLLGVLGVVFCLVYERTGSLLPVIALHAFNNALAFSVQADGEAVAAVLGPLMIAACILAPRFIPAPPRAVTGVP